MTAEAPRVHSVFISWERVEGLEMLEPLRRFPWAVELGTLHSSIAEVPRVRLDWQQQCHWGT